MQKSGQRTVFALVFVSLSACLIYAISSGLWSNYGVMISAMVESSGVAYQSVSFCLAVAQLMVGVVQPIFGVVALKRSNSFVIGIGAVMISAGLIMLPFRLRREASVNYGVANAWQYYLELRF